jgi:Spy/CpxP family protein refolding chaperone
VSATKTTVLAAAALLLTFATGLFVGFGVGRFSHFARMSRGGPPPFATRMMLARLDHRLDLTDAQEKQIRAIFEKRHARMQQELSETNAEVERVLTPAQREKFKAMRLHMAGRNR